MPKLNTVYSITDLGDTHYSADVDIDFSDIGGDILRCPYVVSAADPAPICEELWQMIATNSVAIIPYTPPQTQSSTGGPVVIS